MSNATSPPAPRSSSPAPAADAEGRQRADSSSGEGEFDTSIGQSAASTSREEVGGDSGGKTDTRQKRKRTSPADQVILEAEYKQNPKPNKAARADIVAKVTLNEKEVQIWFQNRRQINRRKSRPLLPHEIAAFGLGGMAALSSDPASIMIFSSSQSGGEVESSSQQEMYSSQEDAKSCQNEVEPLLPEAVEERVEDSKLADVEPAVVDKSVSPPPILRRQASSGISNAPNSSTTDSVIKSFSSTPGYLANRWNSINSSFSSPASSQLPTFTTPPISTANKPASCPERHSSNFTAPSSRVRLSFGLDGKAKLLTGPSPPHEHPARPTSSAGPIPLKRLPRLQRSYSALPYTQLPAVSHVIPPFVPRLPTGRSRDARTWEFCCDPEAQDELTTQAENESHGSALAAISLIRSASNSALKANPNKRNSPSVKHDSSKQGKRAKLGRATSSLARLQNPSKPSKATQQPSNYSKDGLMNSPSGDSDKENWLPNDHSANVRRRPLPSSKSEKQYMPRAVLGDNHNIPTHAFGLGGGRNRYRKEANAEPEIFEDQENSGRAPAEVEKFMRGDVSPSKKGDLDCIQGLLSLSQGNWR